MLIFIVLYVFQQVLKLTRCTCNGYSNQQGRFSDVPPDECYTTKSFKNTFFHIFVPGKETFTLAPGMGMGGEPFRPPLITNNRKKHFVRKLFTLLGHFPTNLKQILKTFLKYVHIYRKIHRIR